MGVYNCPNGYNRRITGSTSYSQSNCCQATCAVYNCPNGYNRRNTGSTSYSQSNCCQACSPCGCHNSDDCRREYAQLSRDNFCRRCSSEGGSSPLRTRCKLCCDTCGDLSARRRRTPP